MTAKTIFKLVGQLLLIQAVISQCVREPACACGTSSYAANSLSNFGLSDNYVNCPLPAGFPLPTQPIGISVSADSLVIDGCLNAVGTLPFLSSVQVDGTVPSKGQVGANFSFGDGNVGITSADSLLTSGAGPVGLPPNYNRGSLGAPSVIYVSNPGGCACV